MVKSSHQVSTGYRSAQRAEDYLRGQIVEGFFEPGSRISDARISEIIDVGRTSVREAIQRLSKEGLIDLIPNRGAFVAELSVKQIHNLFELREALETYAVRLAALRASAERLNTLQEMLTVSKLALVKHGGQYPVQLDFHERVVALSDNEALIAECREVSNRLRVARTRSGSLPARADEALAEHQRVVSALLERNPDQAEIVMREHLEHAKTSFMSLRTITVQEQTPLVLVPEESPTLR